MPWPPSAANGRRASVGADPAQSWPASDTVELWLWDLDAPDAGGQADRDILSPDECARADRFIVPHGARRFAAGRARMRRALAAAVGTPAAAVPLGVGANGKPTLPGGPEFNLSHSGSLALFAMATFPVGVDIERIRSIETGVACLVFSPSELREWAEAGHSQTMFYRGWTRKEAVLKAQGGSLAEIRSFSVSFGQAGFLHGDPAWHIADVPVPAGYAAAVAAPRQEWHVVHRSGPDVQRAPLPGGGAAPVLRTPPSKG